MIKKFTTILGLLLMLCVQMQAQEFESATDAVKNMGVGWNLGNTLDANKADETWTTTEQHETCWLQPVTTFELMKMMKDAGFTAIRIPITWYQEIDENGTVKEAWMNRVKEVVDYVLDNGMYCIINVHHDTGADVGAWIKASGSNYAANKEKYEVLWKQIAEKFKDYGQNLLFEAYNEMLDENNCWNYPTYSNNGKYDEAAANDSYEAVNSYAQSFVNVVRATGGNNATRNLIVNPYAASSGGIWGTNTHPQEPLTEMKLPQDEVANHLIFEVHSYPNIENGLQNAKNGLDTTIESLNTILKAKGAPVIIGEWGTSNVDNGSDYIDRRKSLIDFCDYFVKKCKENDIATFYWMGLSDGQYRSQLVFNQADLAETITKAYHGDDFQGVYPAVEVSEETVIFEGEQQLEWGQAIQFPATLFTDLGSTSTVEVTYVQNYADLDADNQYGMLQFWYGDWSEMINVSAEGQEFAGDFVPIDVYGTESGTEHTTVFSFDKDTFQNFKKKGMLFQGHGILVTKVVLKAGEKPEIEPQEDAEVFWEGDEMLDWGDGLQLIIPAEKFVTFGKDVKMTLYYTLDFTDYNMIQLFYGDWSANPSFIINGQEIEKEFRPSDLHGLQNGDVWASELTFSEAVYNQIAEKGIALQGHGIRLNQVVLEASGTSGIQRVIKADDASAPIYNLAGQRVTNPTKGIYIRNGKKIVIK